MIDIYTSDNGRCVWVTMRSGNTTWNFPIKHKTTVIAWRKMKSNRVRGTIWRATYMMTNYAEKQT